MNVAASPTLQFTGAPVTPNSPELRNLIGLIAEGASQREFERRHPYEAVELIRAARLGALRIPASHGGGGASLRGLIETVIALGAADPNVAHVLRNHFSFVERFAQPGIDPDNGRWLEEVVAGKIFGLASGELTAVAVGGGALETLLQPEGEGYVLNGVKYYSTGTLYADYVLVRAQDAEGRFASVIVPTNRDGVVREDDWDGVGQRLTGTGTTRLNEVRVEKDEVFFDQDGRNYSRPYNGTIAHLFLTAILAGIIRNVLEEAKALVGRRARSFSHAPAERPVDDPLLQQVIGQIASSAFAAEATVLAAADALDRATASIVGDKIDEELAHEAALAASKAKVIVDELAIRAGSQLFDVGGASAAKRSYNLDRHWRNARTLAAHNPASYKAQAIGRYEVSGEVLPKGGFF